MGTPNYQALYCVLYCMYCTVLCAGTRVGTPNYQAPEMLRTHREETPGYTMAADWWSYGVLVYEVSEDRCPGSNLLLVESPY